MGVISLGGKSKGNFTLHIRRQIPTWRSTRSTTPYRRTATASVELFEPSKNVLESRHEPHPAPLTKKTQLGKPSFFQNFTTRTQHDSRHDMFQCENYILPM